MLHVCYQDTYHDDGRVQPPPVPELIDDKPEFEVGKIFHPTVIKRSKQSKVEHLLRFTGYRPEHTCGYLILRTVMNCCAITGVAKL